jgi:hypothetical protein
VTRIHLRRILSGSRRLHLFYPIAAGAIIAALTALVFWLAERYVR